MKIFTYGRLDPHPNALDTEQNHLTLLAFLAFVGCGVWGGSVVSPVNSTGTVELGGSGLARIGAPDVGAVGAILEKLADG